MDAWEEQVESYFREEKIMVSLPIHEIQLLTYVLSMCVMVVRGRFWVIGHGTDLLVCHYMNKHTYTHS